MNPKEEVQKANHTGRFKFHALFLGPIDHFGVSGVVLMSFCSYV